MKSLAAYQSPQPTASIHVYQVRPLKDRRGVDLISDALPFGSLWYGEPDAISNAAVYAKFRSRSHHAVNRLREVSQPFISCCLLQKDRLDPGCFPGASKASGDFADPLPSVAAP